MQTFFWILVLWDRNQTG